MKKVKKIIKKTPGIRQAYQKGFFERNKRALLVVNFIFQRIFRLNSDSPWSVNFTSVVIVPNKIEIDKSSLRNFIFGRHCYIQANNGIIIGKNVWWGSGVSMISANHDPENMVGHLEAQPIKIGDGSWIGNNAVILPGVELGENVTVGAGAIVTKSFPDNVVVAGNPAKIIKEK